MSVLLRLTALLSLGWTVGLIGWKEHLIGAEPLSPVVHAMANALGMANLVLAYIFWGAARNPGASRGIVFAAIALLGLKVGSDLYDLLVLLPPRPAVVSLADLVVSLVLLVAMLEGLPRILGGALTTEDRPTDNRRTDDRSIR